MSDHSHDHASHDHAGPNFKAYISVFMALCVLTGMSFVANFFFHQNQPQLSMWIILGVACVKAFLVASIFMHLKYDWNRLYFIVIPVCVMGVMMMIVLLPDIVLAWHK